MKYNNFMEYFIDMKNKITELKMPEICTQTKSLSVNIC